LLAVLALCLLATGCGKNKVTKANYEKIKNDMTYSEVKAILGEPTDAGGDGSNVAAQAGVDVNMGARAPTTVTRKWESGDNEIFITFNVKQETVTHKRSPSFDK
jgi:hypothetical protein